MTESTNSKELQRQIEQLYQTHQRPIQAHLVRLTRNYDVAQDLCQETFVKALRHWNGHEQPANVTAWLYRIATNTAYDYLRRQQRIQFLPLLAELDHVHDRSLETRLALTTSVQDALRQIPLPEQIPLVLYCYQGYSTHEIAAALGCSSGAVRLRLLRGRKRFRQAYQGQGASP